MQAELVMHGCYDLLARCKPALDSSDLQQEASIACLRYTALGHSKACSRSSGDPARAHKLPAHVFAAAWVLI